MLIKEIMTPSAEIVQPQTSVKDAASRMKDLGVGVMPVGDNDRLVGMLTDRDIAVRTVAEGQDPEKVNVGDIMTPDITYCFEDQDLTEAGELMKKDKVRRLVVLNSDKRMVGMCTLGDLAVHGDRGAAADVLVEVSKPAEPKR
ncbi:CBS domain-containing protein [candidate division GN15 bacterium]|nr:CBS domain-containing protein [candidate division GN15 bacterium]